MRKKSGIIKPRRGGKRRKTCTLRDGENLQKGHHKAFARGRDPGKIFLLEKNGEVPLGFERHQNARAFDRRKCAKN